MTDPIVVPDELREKVRKAARSGSPETAAVLAGKTVFVPLNGKSASDIGSNWHTRISSATDRTKRAVTRVYIHEGVKGILVWAEDRESQP